MIALSAKLTSNYNARKYPNARARWWNFYRPYCHLSSQRKTITVADISNIHHKYRNTSPIYKIQKMPSIKLKIKIKINPIIWLECLDFDCFVPKLNIYRAPKAHDHLEKYGFQKFHKGLIKSYIKLFIKHFYCVRMIQSILGLK